MEKLVLIGVASFLFASGVVEANPFFFKCDEPIEVSGCVVKGHTGACTYRNLSKVGLDEIGVYEYDKSGAQLGMDWRVYFHGMPPGGSMRDEFVIQDDVEKIVFCSVDPRGVSSLEKITDVQFKGIGLFGY